MEIMNYNQMLENANAVKVLVNKTIECSKDYTDSKKGDIVEQMVEYIQRTLSVVCALEKRERNVVIGYIMKYLHNGLRIISGPFGGDGEGAAIQIFFNRFSGDLIRAYVCEDGYWFSQKKISDKGLECLIECWSQTKEDIDTGIKEGVYMLNLGKKSELEKQLKLHEAVKNFKI